MNDQQDHFLEHLSHELSLPCQEDAIPFVSSVMQALRLTLSRQNADALLARLPEVLQNCFRGGQKEENQVHVEHLDELVALVMERDKQNPKSLFKSELQTLSVILFTLKKIFTMVDPKVAGFSQPFFQEVRNASMEISI